MGKKTLLRGGTVLTMDDRIGDLDPGDLLIDGDRIRAVEPSIEADVDEVIDADGAIVMPGMIDCHVHLWQTPVRGVASSTWGTEYFGVVHPLSARYRPEDNYSATYGGALELLRYGVTSVLDFCHSTNSPEHADASCDALDAAGIRALFGYGFRDRPEVAQRAFDSLEDRISDVKRLHGERSGSAGGRLGIAVAMNNMDHVSPEDHARELGCARDLGARATIHSNLADEVGQDADAGLLGEDVLWVHCAAIADGELDQLARLGGAIICSPEIEAGLMAITPIVGRALRRSVPVGLGVDVPSAVNGSLIAQLRATYAIDRMVDSQTDRRQGRVPHRTPWTPTLDGRRMLLLATLGAARVLGLDGQTGSLTPGKLADVTVVSTEPFGLGGGDAANHVVFQANATDVDAVFVAGEPRVRDGELVDVDLARMREGLDLTRDYVLGRSPDAEWEELSPAVRAHYEAHQGTPIA